MSGSEPSKRRIGTGGEIVLGAIVGAVLGWPINRALDGWANDSKLPVVVYILGYAIGIAFVLLVMTFFIKRWRMTIWGGVGRGLKWLWSWHPVSARRLQASRDADFAEIDKFFAANLPTFVRKIIADDGKTNAEIKEILMPVFELRAKAMIEADKAEAQKADTHVENLWATVPVVESSPPLPKPRWTIELASPTSTEDFVLVNHVPRSVAREVRIEGDNDITITSAGHWEDLSGSARGEFSGELSTNAYAVGVNFYLTWFDETGTQQTDNVLLRQSTINKSTPF